MGSESKWEVRIQFTDGRVYENIVTTETNTHAFKLALIDARMGSPFGTFHAPVQSWEATVVEEVPA
jgi:hypothetical protein